MDMYRHIRAHLPQFLTYLVSGGMAAAMELGSYKLLLFFEHWAPTQAIIYQVLGIEEKWYLVAATLSAGVGLICAFTFHKYLVFKKKQETTRQVMRYIVLQAWNAFAQVMLVYVFVEYLSIDPFLAKILGIGCTVMWNFFLYKFFVYA